MTVLIYTTLTLLCLLLIALIILASVTIQEITWKRRTDRPSDLYTYKKTVTREHSDLTPEEKAFYCDDEKEREER